MTSIATPDFWELSSVGVLGPSSEVRFAGESLSSPRSPLTDFLSIDQPETGYLGSNDPPQGEIQIRGGNVFKGFVH